MGKESSLALGVLRKKIAVAKPFRGKLFPSRQDLARNLAGRIGQNADGAPGPIIKSFRLSEFTSLRYEVVCGLNKAPARDNKRHAQFTMSVTKV